MDEGSRSNPATGFYDFSARYAKAFNDKIAFKVNVQYLKADDWQANDFRDQSLLNGFDIANGTRENNPGYNGVNSYGDETSVSMFLSGPRNGSCRCIARSSFGNHPN